MPRFVALIGLLFGFGSLVGCGAEPVPRDHDEWEARGGGPASIRYSSLDQIDTTNIEQLEVAWTYRTGDADPENNSQIQANPIVIDGTLYGTSPKLKVFAVDAATGAEKWVFDPLSGSRTVNLGLNNNRGVTYWEGEDGGGRILMTAGATLFAIDSETGTLIENFGDGGTASLKQGLGERAQDLHVSTTSPGVTYEDLLIMGSRVGEGNDAAPGHIRAFDVRTGRLEWTFHTIPRPGEFGHETWGDAAALNRAGGANSWAGVAVDRERGIVYAPTGSATPDFFGGNRPGKNLFANSLLALDAETGERIWHYQIVHHDLWDRDLPSPPSLVTVRHDGRTVDAVVQTTKMGDLFVFDRETGEPLFPVEERPVPTEGALPGEAPWPTQPRPTSPEPFVRQEMAPDEINPYVPDTVQRTLRRKVKRLRNEHLYDPPSMEGTLSFPGFNGGALWGGNAFDPETNLLYVNANSFPSIIEMVPVQESGTRPGAAEEDERGRQFPVGRAAYRSNCMTCHGPERAGSGEVASLKDVGERSSPRDLLRVIRTGRGRMPGFGHLSDAEQKALVNYLLGRRHYAVDAHSAPGASAHDSAVPYTMAGYNDFRVPDSWVPAVSPPWGTLSAINLNTGEYAWQTPLGEYPALADRDLPPTGAENFGGPAVTTGGLVFIAATPDEKIRAFHKRTGEVLWAHGLPAAGFATPSVYAVDGRQYLVVACGGGKVGAPSGDAYVAFRLPE